LYCLLPFEFGIADARQFIEIGQETYVKLGRFEREAHVFNTIWKNRRAFNKSEIQASIEYIRYLRTMKRLGRID
jgi:Metallopeptidase toxin 4